MNAVDAAMSNIEYMSQDERRALIARLLAQYEADMLEACSDFVRCDACGKLVSRVTEGLQGNDDFTEDCCDDCIVVCVCGTHHAPSGSEHHAECQVDLLEAKVFFTVAGDLTKDQADSLARVMSAHCMHPTKSGWVSGESYAVGTTWTFSDTARQFPGSFFTFECGEQLGEIPLEVDDITLEFVCGDGATREKRFDLYTDERFTAPDAAKYTRLNFRVAMKVAERAAKRSRT